MKKFLLLIFCFCFIFPLSGCGNNAVREANMEYMVSSIGFDKAGQKIKIIAEIIIVNSGQGETGAQPMLFSAVGKSPEDAMYKLHSKLSKPLMLNHSGLLVISKKLSDEAVKEIMNICITDKNITGAIKLIATENAEKLMNIKPNSDIALGYEISNALKQYSEFSGINYKNRFYEIESKREGKTKCYALPYLSARKESYAIEGVLIYKNDSPVLALNNNSAIMYSLMSNSYGQGKIQIDNNQYEINLKSVKYDILYKSETLYVTMYLDIEAVDEVVEYLSYKIKNAPLFDEDIYYFADRISRKKPQVWDKIKSDYKNIFKGANLSFEVI